MLITTHNGDGTFQNYSVDRQLYKKWCILVRGVEAKTSITEVTCGHSAGRISAAFNGTQDFITIFRNARHRSLS